MINNRFTQLEYIEYIEKKTYFIYLKYDYLNKPYSTTIPNEIKYEIRRFGLFAEAGITNSRPKY